MMKLDSARLVLYELFRGNALIHEGLDGGLGVFISLNRPILKVFGSQKSTDCLTGSIAHLG